jgi:hypothetical protein
MVFSRSDWMGMTRQKMLSGLPAAPAVASAAAFGFEREKEEERREGREAIWPEIRHSSWRRRSSREVKEEKRAGGGSWRGRVTGHAE